MEREGRERTEQAMHLQQKPEKQLPLLSSLLRGSSSVGQLGSHTCNTFPQCCTVSPAASVQRKMMQLGSCAVSSLQPGLVPLYRECRGPGNAQDSRGDSELNGDQRKKCPRSKAGALLSASTIVTFLHPPLLHPYCPDIPQQRPAKACPHPGFSRTSLLSSPWLAEAAAASPRTVL